MTKEVAIKAYLPMTETMYYILLALSEPRHGYGIMLHVKEITNGRIVLGAGTIYNSLSRLQRDVLIEPLAESNRRKLYIITEVGMDALKTEISRLEELFTNGKKYA